MLFRQWKKGFQRGCFTPKSGHRMMCCRQHKGLQGFPWVPYGEAARPKMALGSIQKTD
jgi:hypothetical protein